MVQARADGTCRIAAQKMASKRQLHTCLNSVIIARHHTIAQIEIVGSAKALENRKFGIKRAVGQILVLHFTLDGQVVGNYPFLAVNRDDFPLHDEFRTILAIVVGFTVEHIAAVKFFFQLLEDRLIRFFPLKNGG